MANPNSREYKKLQAEWDKKLAASGFRDIEARGPRGGSLKEDSRKFRDNYHNDITRSAKFEYYRAVGHFLYDYEFANPTERRIWALHGEAVSIRNIVKILGKEKLWFVEGGVPHKREVHETLQRLTKAMMDKIEREREDD